jgi:diguanylate cyclase (GGDEF)-like protein/PAS domain S-box-containing protein
LSQVPNEQEKLRKEAEAQLTRSRVNLVHPQPGEDLLHELMHELKVHQIELEMQNDELRKSHIALEESRDRFLDLYEFAPICYLTITRQTTVCEINLTGCTLLGVERKQLINQRFSKFVAPQDRDRWHRGFMSLMEQADFEKQSIELAMLHADGSIFYAHLDCLRREVVNAQPSLRIALFDITELKIAEAKLRIAAKVFESQEGMMVADASGLIVSVNTSFTNITGYAQNEVLGKNPNMLSSGRHDADFYAAMWGSIKRLGFWEGEIWDKRKNGEIYSVHLIITAVKDLDGVVTHYVGTHTDNTLSRNAADEIQHLAFFDPLTRLPNRRLLLDRLKLALASSTRSGKGGALLFLDLDNFKTLNDTLGHEIGDSLLQQTSRRILSCVGEGDTLARLGGDEFVVMLEGLSEQPLEAAAQAEVVGSKILIALSQPSQLDENEYIITTSIGATVFNKPHTGIDELLKQADIAMYQSKKAGGNTLRFFDQQMQVNINTRVALEKELIAAIKMQQFELYYQVQVDSNRKPVGAEALIRWHHPKRMLVSPLAFIPHAEETGLIVAIGKWVLETACAQLSIWQHNELTKELTLSVNVSARQFREADFVDQVSAAVKKHNINPMLLKLEPTESVLLENLDATIATMSQLKALGVRFALDDFGTGFSSLQYLKKLPLNQLKIDRSFVKELVSDNNDKAIVRTIIAMAQSLNLDVIAEGVETEEQQLILQLNGCNHYQGYLFGKPVPIDEFQLNLEKQGIMR